MASSGPRELAVLDQALRMLAEAKSVEDIKAIRDKAEAARTYARAAKLGLEMQNRAAELKLRAERQAGKFLASLKLRGGDRRSKRHHASLKLEALGISRDQSKRWQRVASIAEREFEEYLRTTKNLGRELTSAGLLRVAGIITACGRSRRANRRGPIEVVGQPTEAMTDPQSLITELMNHCQLLADVLRPVYEDSGGELERAERRIVARLLAEMSDLMRHLKSEWCRTSDFGRFGNDS